MVTETELAAHLDALRKRMSDLETDVRELSKSIDIIEEFLDETLNIRWAHPELQVQENPAPVKESDSGSCEKCGYIWCWCSRASARAPSHP